EGWLSREVIEERRWLAEGGFVVVSLAIDSQLQLRSGPTLLARGLAPEENVGLSLAERHAHEQLQELSTELLRVDARIKETVVAAVGRTFQQLFGRKPPVFVMVIRL